MLVWNCRLSTVLMANIGIIWIHKTNNNSTIELLNSRLIFIWKIIFSLKHYSFGFCESSASGQPLQSLCVNILSRGVQPVAVHNKDRMECKAFSWFSIDSFWERRDNCSDFQRVPLNRSISPFPLGLLGLVLLDANSLEVLYLCRYKTSSSVWRKISRHTE